MFDALLRRLTASSPSRLPDPDARLALAALLVRVARADHDYAAVEVERIDRVLATRFNLAQDAVVALRKQAEALEKAAPDTVRFTRALKDAVPHEDRAGLMKSLWAVALADGTKDADEEQELRLIANLLGLSDVDSALARKKMEQSRP